MTSSNQFRGPHQGLPVLFSGAPVERAKGGMILMHGRGADAHDILSLAAELDEPQFFYAAPEARDHNWYPHSFVDPISDNEPEFTSALKVIDDLVKDLAAQALPPEQLILLGFSQGACLVLEYATRNPRRYGGIVALAGCLFGPPDMERELEGSLQGTPALLGCGDSDPHFPAGRVEGTAEVLGSLGAEVTTRIYPGLGHEVNEDEIKAIKHIVELVEASG
jgi:glyoxalase family protein